MLGRHYNFRAVENKLCLVHFKWQIGGRNESFGEHIAHQDPPRSNERADLGLQSEFDFEAVCKVFTKIHGLERVGDMVLG